MVDAPPNAAIRAAAAGNAAPPDAPARCRIGHLDVNVRARGKADGQDRGKGLP